MKLSDETEFWGYLRHYSHEDTAVVREIVLGGDTLLWKPKCANAHELTGNRWGAVSANAEEIKFIRVIYRFASSVA